MKKFLQLTTAAVSVFATLGVSAQMLDTLELRTSYDEVYGVRDIEAGEYQTGIEKLEAIKRQTSIRQDKANIHTNLCVAYAAQGNLEKAAANCSQAVELHTSNRDRSVAYNNLAVLQFMQGDSQASLGDLEMAKYLNPQNDVTQRNMKRVLTTTQIASN